MLNVHGCSAKSVAKVMCAVRSRFKTDSNLSNCESVDKNGCKNEQIVGCGFFGWLKP